MDTMEMVPVSWYEASLPLRERKQRGHFSTPPLLVERILDACGYRPKNDLSQLRVLDPACGSGNFLAGAARRLAAFAARTGLSPDEMMVRNLWGFDPDPVSCLLAEMNVRAQYSSWKDGNADGRRRADKSAVGAINRPLRDVPELLLNVRDSDAMDEGSNIAIRQDVPELLLNVRDSDAMDVGSNIAARQDVPELLLNVRDSDAMDVGLDIAARLHIHQADGLALPWDGYEGIDLFLANPPYLAAKNTDLSSYRSTYGSGQLDSYLLFLDLALSVVRPGGWLGLVLPDPVLARSNASRQRTRLLETCTITHLWHLSGVFAASVGAVVLIAQKCPTPATHLISWERASWSRGSLPQVEERRGEALNTVPQSLFQRQPGAELRYLLSSERGILIERLRAHLARPNGSERRLVPLSDFLTIRRGEELGRKSARLVRNCPDHPAPPPGHPQGVALLYTPPSHSPRRDSLASRASGSVYSRADPGGRPGVPGMDGRPESAGGSEGEYFPVLLGGVDVKPYGTPVGRCWLAGEAIEKPLERYLAPKLLVVKSTGQLQAALDVHGHVVLQTLYLLQVRCEDDEDSEDGEADKAGEDGDELYFFLALLNSRLLREYVYVLHTAYKWVQPQIEQHVLARLPVPLAGAAEKREIIERAKLLMELLRLVGQEEICSEAGAVVELKQQWQGFYEEQERAIVALYAAALPQIRLTTESRRYGNG